MTGWKFVFAAEHSRLEIIRLTLRFDAHFVFHIVGARDLCRLFRDGLSFVFRAYRAFQRDSAVLRDDLDIVRVRRKRFVRDDSSPDFAC